MIETGNSLHNALGVGGDWINANARKIPCWAIYVLGLAPIPWLFWRALNGQLGIEPIEQLEHRYGLLGLQFLLGGLAITPLRRLFGLNFIKFRRAIGVTAFFYILAHLSVWLILDVQSWGAIWKDIVKRPYITVGMLGFLALLPLALSSNNWSVRTLGALRWRRLHKLTYPAIILGCLHYVLLVKGFPLEPLFYLGICTLFLVYRVLIFVFGFR